MHYCDHQFVTGFERQILRGYAGFFPTLSPIGVTGLCDRVENVPMEQVLCGSATPSRNYCELFA